jgi:hypothetical protein
MRRAHACNQSISKNQLSVKAANKDYTSGEESAVIDWKPLLTVRQDDVAKNSNRSKWTNLGEKNAGKSVDEPTVATVTPCD